MNILGIETSCDETSAAIVKDGRFILSNIILSSLKEHQKYGGVIPEIASRRQMEFISIVVHQALEKAKLELKDMDAIAVTQSPGLIGSLLVGLSFARSLSFATHKPLIEIDHVKAHLYANWLLPSLGQKNIRTPKLPAIGLIVSGGHSSLYHIRNYQNFELLGQTRDDAAGEAFDKVARILELGYPGGPVIDKLAPHGENQEIQFPGGELPGSFDFSFSGLKTAVLYYSRKHQRSHSFNKAKVAYAFQKNLVSVLVKKSIEACQMKKIKTLVIGGGVAANSALRATLQQQCEDHRIQVFFPPPSLCIDNAAMVAGLGYHQKKGET